MVCCSKYQLHPLHNDESATLEAMLPGAQSIRLLPTHCISESAELQGFCITVKDSALGSALPFNREMFFGHSLFECKSANPLINADVVRLMSQTTNSVRLCALIKQMERRALTHEACFDCAPDNADAVMGLHGTETQVRWRGYARSNGLT